MILQFRFTRVWLDESVAWPEKKFWSSCATLQRAKSESILFFYALINTANILIGWKQRKNTMNSKIVFWIYSITCFLQDKVLFENNLLWKIVSYGVNTFWIDFSLLQW